MGEMNQHIILNNLVHNSRKDILMQLHIIHNACNEFCMTDDRGKQFSCCGC